MTRLRFGEKKSSVDVLCSFGEKFTLFTMPSAEATDYYVRNHNGSMSPVYSYDLKEVTFKKMTLRFTIQGRTTYKTEFAFPGLGTIRFRNSNPHDSEYTFEIYLHEKADMVEREPIFEIPKATRLEYVGMRKVTKKH